MGEELRLIRRATPVLQDRLTIAKDVIAEQTPLGVTLFHTGGARYWQGNEMAAQVVDYLSASRTHEEIVDHISNRAEMSRDVIQRDVARLLHTLSTAGLIRVEPR